MAGVAQSTQHCNKQRYVKKEQVVIVTNRNKHLRIVFYTVSACLFVSMYNVYLYFVGVLFRLTYHPPGNLLSQCQYTLLLIRW